MNFYEPKTIFTLALHLTAIHFKENKINILIIYHMLNSPYSASMNIDLIYYMMHLKGKQAQLSRGFLWCKHNLVLQKMPLATIYLVNMLGQVNH